MVVVGVKNDNATNVASFNCVQIPTVPMRENTHELIDLAASYSLSLACKQTKDTQTENKNRSLFPASLFFPLSLSSPLSLVPPSLPLPPSSPSLSIS